MMDWYLICIDELDIDMKFGIHKTHELYPTSYSMCRNPSFGSRPRQGGCKRAGL
jgi:hypothetical protein